MKKRKQRKKKLALEQTARKLAALAEKHLESIPEEEREFRVAAFERTISRASYRTTSRSSRTADTQVTRVVARGRE